MNNDDALYRLTLETLLRAVEQRRPQTLASLILVPEADNDLAAQNTSWGLLASGVQHLAAGGVGDAPGLLTVAISKASLRSAPLAAALHIQPPTFEQVAVLASGFKTVHDEARMAARNLAAAVQADIAVSREKINEALGRDVVLGPAMGAYFNHLADVHRANCATLIAQVAALPAPTLPSKPPKPSPGNKRFSP